MWDAVERRSQERLLMDRLKEDAAEVRRAVQERIANLLGEEPVGSRGGSRRR